MDPIIEPQYIDNAELNTVDLAIFMGQSNMAGRGEAADATLCQEGHGYEFRAVTDPTMLYAVTEPFGANEDNSVVNDYGSNGVTRRSGDMVSSLMESYYLQTKVPIVGVCCSRGGTSTSYWTGDTVLNEAISRLTAAKTYLQENGYNVRHVFMVWCQGESDADSVYSGSLSTDTYKSRTLSIFNKMMSAGVEKVFIVQTGHYNYEYSPSSDTNSDLKHDEAYVAVANVQAEIAESTDNIELVASFQGYKAYMKDCYHFHQAAYNEVGASAGAAIAGIYNSK
ncbi:MAG: sialate O-acetylesterase [Clostridia bacterium]|nr:sialate O-acetylesterase [Clostridia bacterium]